MYDPYNDKKYVEVVDKLGICKHIDMNELGFFNHSEGYYYYILEFQTQSKRIDTGCYESIIHPA